MKYRLATAAIHTGQEPEPHTGAVIPAISLSTTYKQDDVGVHKGFEYSRSDNPNRRNLETVMAALEEGQYALAFASGSAATASIVHMFPTGTHILSVNDVYGGTYRYFTKVAAPQGYSSTFVELVDPNSIKQHIMPNTRARFNNSVDIEAISKIVKAVNPEITIVVDNTFLSPYFQKPLLLGADFVVHSMTKYLNGHSDAVMGIAITRNKSLYERLKFLQNAIGAVPSPFDCYMVHRGIKTLAIRMEAHQKSAMKIATFLQSHPQVQEVIYPGLKSHPQHELAKRQQTGFGGMISFRIKGTLETSKLFLRSLKIFALAESLGGIESLAELPSMMTHGSVSAEDRAKLGITDTLIRLSVGLEDVDDLIEDLKTTLEKVSV